MKNMRTKTCLALVVLLSFSACKEKISERAIHTVDNQDVIQRITVSGQVIPNMTTTVQSSFSGYIRKIYPTLGAKVEKGNPLVLLSQTLDARVGEAFPVRAPFTGTVVQILKTEGEYIEQTGGTAKDRTIMRVDDLTRLFIEADVPEVDFLKIKRGQDVIVRIAPINDATFKGIVREMSLAAKDAQNDYGGGNSKVVFTVRIEVLEKNEDIRPGMTALVDIIPQQKKGVIAVPHDYLYAEEDSYYVIMENGEKRMVKAGIQNEDLVEITEGLAKGDKIRQVDFSTFTVKNNFF